MCVPTIGDRFCDLVINNMRKPRYLSRNSEELLTKHFYASLKHKNVDQTKFIKPNSQR